MRAYEVYIADDRYSLPTLRIVEAVDAFGAQETAERFMRESPHHLGVEVCDRGQRIFTIGDRRSFAAEDEHETH